MLICITASFNQYKPGEPQARRNRFQSRGAFEHRQVLSGTMVGQEEKFLNSRRSRMAKTVTF